MVPESQFTVLNNNHYDYYYMLTIQYYYFYHAISQLATSSKLSLPIPIIYRWSCPEATTQQLFLLTVRVG
jgi:hypothetical protein